MGMATAETARARRRVVTEAGWGTTSFISVLAGTLVAFGAVALVAAAAGAAGSALGLDTNGISTREWQRAGVAGAAVAALILFGSFFLGGYTAGRMSRRAGARHGLLVFVLTAAIIGGVALVGWALAGNVNVTSSLQDNGVPTDQNTWGDIGVGAAIAGGIAILLGSVAGAIKGERWHGRLATAVVEHREAQREQERARTQRQGALVGEDPVDGTRVDLRDDTVATELTVEEERERARVDGAQL